MKDKTQQVIILAKDTLCRCVVTDAKLNREIALFGIATHIFVTVVFSSKKFESKLK